MRLRTVTVLFIIILLSGCKATEEMSPNQYFSRIVLHRTNRCYTNKHKSEHKRIIKLFAAILGKQFNGSSICFR